eukprot:2236547-Pleurochrysis_carterae.AAC.1
MCIGLYDVKRVGEGDWDEAQATHLTEKRVRRELRKSMRHYFARRDVMRAASYATRNQQTQPRQFGVISENGFIRRQLRRRQ